MHTFSRRYLMLTLSCCACTADRPQAPITGPAATDTISIRSIDAGECFSGDVITRETQLSNESDSLVTILKTSTGCACTSVAASDQSVRPHESTTLTVSATPRTPNPAFNGMYTITLDNGREIKGYLKAQVLSRYRVNFVTLLRAPSLCADTHGELEIQLENLSNEDITINELQLIPSTPLIQLELENHKLTAKGASKLRATIHPHYVWTKDLTLRASLSQISEPVLDIPIAITPVDSIRLSPTSIHLGAMDAEKASRLDRHIAITAQLTPPSHWTIVDVQHPTFLCTPKVTNGADGMLSFTFSRNLKDPLPSDLSSNIEIHFLNSFTDTQHRGIVNIKGFAIQ